MSFPFLRIPMSLTLLVAVGGCVATPVGLAPAVIPEESTSYFLHSVTPRFTLSNGDVFGVSRVCSVNIDEASARAATLRLAQTMGKECSPQLGVFLRHGEHWEPLYVQKRERQITWDEVLLPEVLEDSAASTLLFVSAAWSRKDFHEGQLLRYAISVDRVTLVVLDSDGKTMQKLALPPFCGDSQGINADDNRRMTVILSGEQVFLLLRSNAAARLTCDEQITYSYARERSEIDLGEDQTQIFIGNARRDGTMRQATHNHEFAGANAARYVYFDGRLPANLGIGSTASLRADHNLSDPPVAVICKYHWRGLQYTAAIRTHETSLEDCHQNNW